MDIDRLLNFASTAGKMMLQSGGEIYRVEETVSVICKSFNIDEVDVFASPTAVVVSIILNGKIHTVVKRISSRGVNLNRVHNINSLSRKIYLQRPSLEECEKELKEICSDDSYNLSKILISAGLATAAFTILFGGHLSDFICAFIIGILIKILVLILGKSALNEFFINALCGAMVAGISVIFLNIGFLNEIDKVIAGSIMLLVPGLLLTNSIRDILDGQLVSGLTKAAEALFIGISTAAGAFLVLHLFLQLGGL